MNSMKTFSRRLPGFLLTMIFLLGCTLAGLQSSWQQGAAVATQGQQPATAVLVLLDESRGVNGVGTCNDYEEDDVFIQDKSGRRYQITQFFVSVLRAYFATNWRFNDDQFRPGQDLLLGVRWFARDYDKQGNEIVPLKSVQKWNETDFRGLSAKDVEGTVKKIRSQCQTAYANSLLGAADILINSGAAEKVLFLITDGSFQGAVSENRMGSLQQVRNELTQTLRQLDKEGIKVFVLVLGMPTDYEEQLDFNPGVRYDVRTADLLFWFKRASDGLITLIDETQCSNLMGVCLAGGLNPEACKTDCSESKVYRDVTEKILGSILAGNDISIKQALEEYYQAHWADEASAARVNIQSIASNVHLVMVPIPGATCYKVNYLNSVVDPIYHEDMSFGWNYYRMELPADKDGQCQQPGFTIEQGEKATIPGFYWFTQDSPKPQLKLLKITPAEITYSGEDAPDAKPVTFSVMLSGEDNFRPECYQVAFWRKESNLSEYYLDSSYIKDGKASLPSYQFQEYLPSGSNTFVARLISIDHSTAITTTLSGESPGTLKVNYQPNLKEKKVSTEGDWKQNCNNNLSISFFLDLSFRFASLNPGFKPEFWLWPSGSACDGPTPTMSFGGSNSGCSTPTDLDSIIRLISQDVAATFLDDGTVTYTLRIPYKAFFDGGCNYNVVCYSDRGQKKTLGSIEAPDCPGLSTPVATFVPKNVALTSTSTPVHPPASGLGASFLRILSLPLILLALVSGYFIWKRFKP